MIKKAISLFVAILAIFSISLCFYHNNANASEPTVSVGTAPYSVALNPNTNTIYVTNYNSNNVSVINGATNTVTTTVTVGTNPYGVTVDPNTDTIYVTNFNSNNVSVIDGATNTVTTTVSVGTNPYGVAVNPNTDTIYVTNFNSNNVSVIDGATNTVTATISAGTNPVRVAVNPTTNTIYVANFSSNNVSVIDGATTLPDVPTSVTGVAGNSSATISWSPPTTYNYLPVTGYAVGLYPSNGSAPIINIYPNNVFTADISNLIPGVSYSYSVTAMNSDGSGVPFLSSSSVVPYTVPNAPTNVVATASNASANVTWNAPVNNGGSAITGYSVTPYQNGVAQTPVNTTTTSLAFTNTLTNGDSYVFVVTANNIAGASVSSLPSNAVTPITVPNAPTNVVATSIGNDSVNLSWSAPVNNGGSAITGYSVTSTPSGVSLSTTGTSVTIGSLTSGTSYTFTITANNQSGSSTPTTSSSVLVKSGYFYSSLASPVRVYDTRSTYNYNGKGQTMSSGSVNTISFVGFVPSNAVAVAINVTVTNTTSSSYLTLYPTGEPRSPTSSLNWTTGQTIANMSEVRLGDNQSINVFNFSGSADLVVDLQGYYSTSSTSSYVPIAPVRIFDSRNSSPITKSAVVSLPSGLPPNLTDAVIQVTGIQPSLPTFLTIYPDSTTQPSTSNLNLSAGQILGNLAIIPIVDGKIDISNYQGTINVAMDLMGYYETGASNPNLFHPMASIRVLDTRPNSPAFGTGQTLAPNRSISVVVGTPSNTVAVTGNLTSVTASGPGFLNIGSTQNTSTSNNNFVNINPVANFSCPQVSSNGLIYVNNGPIATVNAIFDITGWFG